MHILIVGSGGREHAIVRALAANPDQATGQPHELHAAPGNPGMAQVAQLHDVDPLDGPAVAALAQRVAADLVVVGPEAPLAAGVADAVRHAGIACFGPSAGAARLEASKAFAKQVMEAAGVPTAAARVCDTEAQVAAALDEFGPPHVVKDDGLAAGKGVVVTSARGEALAHARACLAAGHQVVIEEYLDGPEVSLFCLSDGGTVVPLAPAQDFKRVGDGDTGPNTGGMGAYSPLPWAPPDLVDEVIATVAHPTIEEMARCGIPFVGVLYCGLALTSRGMRVVEFNVRFGDPETQVVLPRLLTPLAELLFAAATGTLGEAAALEWRDEAAVCVVLAAPGYPGDVATGGIVTGIPAAQDVPGAHVIQAGTAWVAPSAAAGAQSLSGRSPAPDTPLAPGPAEAAGFPVAGAVPDAGGHLVAAGGRVLACVGEGPTVAAARDVAYTALGQIHLEGGHARTDIAAGR